jgi:two-component system, chemotaxis family, CheB/CheR fusion protein
MAKILVIDDDGIVRDALSVFLTRDGHEVVTAADGPGGMLVFRNASPDLVVLDRDLPGMSGSGVFSGIRSISPTVPILILSGYDAPEDVDAYLRGGASAFLSKGGGLSPVLAEIDRLLGVRRKAKVPPEGAAKRAADHEVRRAPGRAAGLLLIADDDAVTRALLRRFLSPLFREILEAGDGAGALELARARRPDLVLLDIDMPRGNGVSVLHELVPELSETGFMMITGNDDEEVARECLRSGAFDYVSKPINLEALGTAIKARLLLQK